MNKDYNHASDAEEIQHVGVSKLDGAPVGSGRYPLGSGENPNQHLITFDSRVKEMRDSGMNDTEIARAMGMSTTEFRAQRSIARAERRRIDIQKATELRHQGKSLTQIAEMMGFENDSSVRSLLNTDSKRRMDIARATADALKKEIDEWGMIDVGKGVERNFGVSRGKLEEALYILQQEGYPVYGGGVPQVTNKGKQTILKVVCPPGTEHKDIYNYENIHSVKQESHDDGETFDKKFVYPKSMDPKRLKVVYAEDGGTEKDGLIELRRGVDDISLGNSQYAQVRILVGGTHYIKGMAVYKDKMPDGVDVIFNTNKAKGTPVMGSKDNTVLKAIKKDPDNPFGSLIKQGVEDPDIPGTSGGQRYYYDKDGKKQLSLINKRAEEGDWGAWADHLPSQFLSKQNKGLIQKQLGLALADRKEEYDEIMSITNPTVKKKLLNSFADDCDAAAVHLKAAALPRQKYQVILPVPTLKDNEIYAPNYRDGEQVALIRYPHGGTFEIPILTVNNKHADSKKMIGTTPADAVCINKKVADRLSGADFDGDTAMVIPCGGKIKITSTRPLSGLEGFDPKLEYGGKPDGTFKKMRNTQTEMGKISNLITDMTLKGAKPEELARAVRHSMVVIDAEKHGLDYKQSEKDNDISALRREYQGRVENGKYTQSAATLISRASSEIDIPKRKGAPSIDKDTGGVVWKNDPRRTFIDKDGKERLRTQKSTQMAETKDARSLSTGTVPEELYADYANKLKALANSSRKELLATPRLKYSPSAKEKYAAEVDSLKAKLNVSLMNAPKERQAQLIANTVVKAKTKADPDLTKAEIKKISQQALTSARAKVGAKRTPIDITEREWEAIQSGAISENFLSQILNHADIDRVRKYATPRASSTLSDAKINKIKAMKNSGYSTSAIADAIGVSSSTVHKYLNGDT